MTAKQADGRFLRGILFVLIVATLASGTVAAVSTVTTGAEPAGTHVAGQR